MSSGRKNGSGGRNERAGDLLINRLVPNEHTEKVGPFVFLGHVYPTAPKIARNDVNCRRHAHPHRGIITISYLLSGVLQHTDSRDHQGTIRSGGAVWMKAGRGIIHEERFCADGSQPGAMVHAIQFWIALPAANKQDDAECRFLPADEIPELELPGDAGALRVVLGGCGSGESAAATYSGEFIYHVRLNPKSGFTHTIKDGMEYAVFVPASEILVNGEAMENSQVILFVDDDRVVRLYNPGISIADAVIFGGGRYLEPVVAAGPFVMNSRKEIAQAYEDFFAGKYGELKKDQ